jgi:hypothetical protein
MRLVAMVTAPSGFTTGGTQWVQLVPSSTTKLYKYLNQPQYQTCTSSGLDTQYPYTTSTTLTDSPFLALDSVSNVEETTSESFDSYLQWQPSGSGIFVSIAHVTWGWSGDATFTNGSWTVKASSVTPPAISSTSTLPTWSKNVTAQTCTTP